MMNIQSMQFAQGLFSAVEGKINSGKGNASAENDLLPQAINLPEAKENLISPDKSSALGSEIDFYYPPFFPIGKTQEIFTVKKEAAVSSRPPSDAGKTVKKETADTEQKQVAKDDPEPVKGSEPKSTAGSGGVLDLKA